MMKRTDIEQLVPDERRAAFEAIARHGEEIAKEYDLEPDQIEVNTAPTGSTWVLTLYIKDEAELRTLLTFMKENDMIVGFE